MPVVRGIRVLNAISTGNTTPACLDTLLSDAGRLADVTQVLSSPSYSCMLGQSNTASHTAFRSNNAMNAIFANPVAGCVLYQTSTSRNNMLGSSCYYNHMMSFSTPEATNSFTHFGNTPCMLACAFASCTAFLNTAVQSNTEITKLLTCNATVSACFRGSNCAITQAVGTPGRPAYWLGDATAFSCLTCGGSCLLSGAPIATAFANSVFLETLNRDVACVMCSPTLNCIAWNTAAAASTYTQNPCATNEVVNKGACGVGLTSCNFVCWHSSCYGVPCMTTFLLSGNTNFMDQVNSLGSFRQRSCLFFLRECRDECYAYCGHQSPACSQTCKSQCLVKADIIARGGVIQANNANLPMMHRPDCNGQRICPMTIANGCQLSNTEIEYLGRFIKCNYNVITHADCRFTLISPGFWNQSSMITCFKSCYCCSIDRTTANTSGLTLNCSLYYTTDNAASFNRLCVPIPACIFQQLCGNCCCQFTIRYGLSSFACCNYIYTGWIISDCATGFGASGVCAPAYFKTGHSRVCLFAANSQPDYSTWTHFPDVPLPFYTIAFCDEYFAGVSPMRTDGYQSTLGLCNQACCQCPGQYAMMFSFGRVGDCVRVSCDNFVTCQPSNVICFSPSTCCVACKSLPGITSCIFGTCYEDYFQGHGGIVVPYCYCYAPYGACIDNHGTCGRLMQAPAGASHTLIYKNSANTADSKAFLVGWRSFAMLYGGTAGGFCQSSCAVLAPQNCYYYNCCNMRAEGLPYGCGYFSSSAGVNVWCYGSQANNTMEGSEILCDALGGSSSSWTNFSFSNAKIIGCRLVLAGAHPPIMPLCQCFSCADYTTGASATGFSRQSVDGYYGCQNTMGQTGHTTVFNTDGVVGTIVCCFDSMYHQTPFSTGQNTPICTLVHYCNYCSGRCFCCMQGVCGCYGIGIGLPFSTPQTSDQAGLKTLNFYGSSNSIYSIPVFPNVVPTFGCQNGTGHQCVSSSYLSCYTSPGGTNVFKSDKSAWCSGDFGDRCQNQFGDCCGPLRPNFNGFMHQCNPGVANAVGITYHTHTFSYSGWTPCYFYGVYTPPTTSQDMSTFDGTFNFCYVITPHRDLCLQGPYCWLQQCECFGPNCCLSIPCAPCCPQCNLVLCCVCGAYCSTIVSCMPICDVIRPTFTRQHVCINAYDDGFPCQQTPNRYCCSAFSGCRCIGNHMRPTAVSNNVFQCATSTYFHSMCACYTEISGCCCSAQNTCCFIRPYDRLTRTCNQSGSNCLWYDFFTSYVPGFGPGDAFCFLPCKTFWNANHLVGHCLCSCTVSLCNQGLAYMALDDSKRGGYQLLSSCQQCTFIVNDVCYPILYATQTRGSGGVLNTQNSIHIAYFDLIPFRCVVLAGSFGFYANGNACPGPSGTTCCLMFSKVDTFYNL